MKFILSFASLLAFVFPLAASDTLSVSQCRELAQQNSPLQQKKLYAASLEALQIKNIQRNSLPKAQLSAQASWQSDVFGLPFNFPNSEIPVIPKDQYKVSLDVSQRIWDGGSDHFLRQQRGLERELAAVQVDVDVFALREIVTDLYFKALLLQESETILASAKADWETRLRQAEAAVAEGVALRSSADQLRIQILKTEQQLAATGADKLAVMAILAKWVGREKVDFSLQMPIFKANSPTQAVSRPEHSLFDLQQKNLQIGKNALALRSHPRIEAFAQGGFGRPNPFNFFETDFEPFLIVGLRAAWNPIDWGNKRREAQMFELQIKNVDAQRAFFDQRLEASTLKDQQDEAKWQAQLAQDDAIIRLQTDIVSRADAQVKNGVMTTTDYLGQVNLLTQAQLTRKTHELQAAQAREMRNAKLGD